MSVSLSMIAMATRFQTNVKSMATTVMRMASLTIARPIATATISLMPVRWIATLTAPPTTARTLPIVIQMAPQTSASLLKIAMATASLTAARSAATIVMRMASLTNAILIAMATVFPTLARWIAMPMAPQTTAKTSPTAMPTVRLMYASQAMTATATASLTVVS